jgi:predicted PurR-regulated permease PerM
MSPRQTQSNDFSAFVRKSLFVAALISLGVLLWFLWGVLLLIFAAALLAIAIRDLALPFARWTPLGTSAAIAVVVLLLLIFLSGAGFVLGAQLVSQLDELWTRLPEFAESAERFVAQAPIGRTVLSLLPDKEQIFDGITAGSALTAATTTLGVVANILVVIFLGLFFALTPRLYTRGVVMLVPPAYRARGEEVLADTASSLRGWLRGQLVAMIAVGAITWVGLTLLGVPLALGLAFLAFLFEFIPVLGPIAAAVPAILVGLSESPMLGLWVALLYIAIQQVESYILLPLLQRWAVNLPPALTLIGIVAFGVLFGWIGVLLATPLMVATTVFIREVYLESILEPAKKR